MKNESIIDIQLPCPEPDRAAWLLTPFSSFGRQTIQTEQYEELRSLALDQGRRMREMEAENAELRDMVCEARLALRRCADALDNGSVLSENASTEFHLLVAQEVRLVVTELRQEVARLSNK